MAPLYINVDMDETVCHLMKGWRAWLHKTHGLDMPHEAFTDYDMAKTTGLGKAVYEYLEHPGCFRYLSPIAGAIDALEQLAKAGHHITFISTCRRYGDTKRDWLRDHVGDRFKYGLVLVEKPEHKGRFHGDVLVDDHVDNLLAFTAHHRRQADDFLGPDCPVDNLAICYAQPWNRDYKGHRARNWTDVMRMIGEIAG